MEIKLSHYRKLFRVGGQAVEGLMGDCNGEDVTVLIDEEIDEDRVFPLANWFLKVGAKSVKMLLTQNRVLDLTSSGTVVV